MKKVMHLISSEKPSRLLMILICLIIASDIIIEIVIYALGIIPPWVDLLLDSTLLLILIFPTLYFLVFRPLKIQITESKQAEEELRESEEKYRWVLDNMADVITVMDMNLNFTYVSPSIIRMRGYTDEEAMAQTLAQVMTPESLQISVKVFEEEMKLEASGTADPGRSRILELAQYRKDGSIVWMENNLSFVRDKAQKPVGIISVSRDITDRKRAEEALIQSEERYRTILDNTQEGYFEVDLAGNFTFVNDAECNDLGYTREELIGMNYKQYTDETAVKKLYELFIGVYRTGEQIKAFEGKFIKKNGTKGFNEISISLITNKEGKPVGFRGLSRDITKRKQAEEALRESEERYRQVVENANEAIFIVQDETIKFFNPKALEIYGYSSDENLPPIFSFIEFIHPEDRGIVLERYQERLKGEDLPHVYPFRIINRQGNIRWVEINSVLISWERRPATLVFLIDINERKQAEEALKTLSLKDDLTGLFNRRGFFTVAEQGLKTAQRMGTEMLLIFGDLDNLKGINDTFGHTEGDQALVDTSQILKETFREADIVARIGGDEFVILAMNSYETSTERLINRFEKVLNDHPLQTKRPYTLSLSLGIAYFDPQNPCSIDVLLAQADKIMYENKQKNSR
ncbi:MAG: PAS domain S-box protein [Bacteroidetes bacterium]|nr:PAS domain S-box protein [Bacteroidota bacterium]